MAEKSGSDERIIIIPLRKEFLKSPRVKRANRAMRIIRAFLARHMKAEESNVRISQKIHEKIWERGAHKPPPKIKVKARKDSDGVVKAMLPEEIETPKEEKKSKIMERLGKKGESSEKSGKEESGQKPGLEKGEVKAEKETAERKGKPGHERKPARAETKK